MSFWKAKQLQKLRANPVSYTPAPQSTAPTVTTPIIRPSALPTLTRLVHLMTQQYISSGFEPAVGQRLQTFVNQAKEQTALSFAVQPGALTPAAAQTRANLSAALKAADTTLLQAKTLELRTPLPLPAPAQEPTPAPASTPWYKEPVVLVLGALALGWLLIR